MKVILVGLGSFGAGWYARIKRDHPGLLVEDPITYPQVQRIRAALGYT